MHDQVHSAERLNESLQLPVLLLIEPLTLTRTSILSILRRELASLEIVDMATTQGLDSVSARDVRLVALSIGDKPPDDGIVEDDLALIAECCLNASIALISNRDDEATALAAMQRGVRGFFPTSLPIEVAVAGLRLVLAGGVYRPLPVIELSKAPGLDQPYPRALGSAYSNGDRSATDRTTTDFTPREQQVLTELELGLPNKLIAAKLNLSENTVKMHIQHIMRKCDARNRTEAVLRWSGRLSAHGRDTDTNASSIPEA
ncbi:response regulator transcription factor [Bradyrhizobium sp. CB82]|uniref:LuxR C-terminal-related transcriptional regulator n=1 Tax=Bradyrhizobium sp. CB82 TaxID=3039159 RepID=UPI0024B12B8C|nr:response regulator transcription factor [Bradyrhizobium sp. CB82]WFU40648.1 response regulator transcription factor [Bradyrhizobium sp. CB82]